MIYSFYVFGQPEGPGPRPARPAAATVRICRNLTMKAILFVVIVLCFCACADSFVGSVPSSSPLHALNTIAIKTSSGYSLLRHGKRPLSMQHEASIPGTWTLSAELEGESSFAVLNLYANRTAMAPVPVQELWRGGRGIWKMNGIDFALEVNNSSEILSSPHALKILFFAIRSSWNIL
jgi:hypothetical protein